MASRRIIEPLDLIEDDGTIYLIYDRNRENDREILLARFTAAAVMDANFFNPGSALRLLVNRAAAVRK